MSVLSLRRLLAIQAALLVAGAAFAAPVSLADRPAEAVALDAARHPAEVLAAPGIKPGATVVDMMAGEGYYSELLARLVGPKGRVVAVVPQTYFDDPKTQPVWDAIIARNPNVTLQKSGPADAQLPPKLDAAFFHLTYHDMYWESAKYKYPRMDPAAFNARLFEAMRPGGLVIIIDHVGRGGDTRAIVDKVHRIDPAVVKADMAKAGFKFIGESPLLHMTGDDPDKLVFDPAVRGKTDRFFYKFKRP